MKRFSSRAAHILITWICFVPALTFICLYEFWFSNIPSNSDFTYKLGIILSKICYSVIAASLFYFVSQYVPVYLPKQRRKIRILPIIYQQTHIVEYSISKLATNLEINGNEFLDNQKFKNVLKGINPDLPIENFQNWHQFLFHLKLELLEVIRSIYFYNDYLSTEFLHELILLEKHLTSPIVFAGYKTLAVTNLSYAEITLQEILIHNNHLQMLREAKMFL